MNEIKTKRPLVCLEMSCAKIEEERTNETDASGQKQCKFKTIAAREPIVLTAVLACKRVRNLEAMIPKEMKHM